MRSMAASASSGFVSQVSMRISHSFGPRAPNSAMSASHSVSNAAADASPASAAAWMRSSTPGTPASKAAVSDSEPRIRRPSRHIA